MMIYQNVWKSPFPFAIWPELLRKAYQWRPPAPPMAAVDASRPQLSPPEIMNPERRSFPEWDPDDPDQKEPKDLNSGNWESRPKQPHADETAPIGQMTPGKAMTLDAGINFGSDQPPGVWSAGHYTAPIRGEPREFFVKKGIVYSPHEPRNATARHEYATQRIIDILANKENGIRPIPSTLHSDENNGVAVPGDYHWSDHIAAYLASTKVPGIEAQFLDKKADRDRLHHEMIKGRLVDAMLMGDDLHDLNYMLPTDGEPGAYRIDVGGYAGRYGNGLHKEEFYTHSAAQKNWSMLPELFNSFQANSKMFGQGNPLLDTQEKRDSAWADHLLRQGGMMIQAWDDPKNQAYIDEAVHHHPYGYQWKEALNNRMQTIRNMVEAFYGHPDVLADLARSGAQPDIANWWRLSPSELRPQVEALAKSGEIPDPLGLSKKYSPEETAEFRDKLKQSRRAQIEPQRALQAPEWRDLWTEGYSSDDNKARAKSFFDALDYKNIGNNVLASLSKEDPWFAKNFTEKDIRRKIIPILTELLPQTNAQITAENMQIPDSEKPYARFGSKLRRMANGRAIDDDEYRIFAPNRMQELVMNVLRKLQPYEKENKGYADFLKTQYGAGANPSERLGILVRLLIEADFRAELRAAMARHVMDTGAPGIVPGEKGTGNARGNAAVWHTGRPSLAVPQSDVDREIQARRVPGMMPNKLLQLARDMKELLQQGNKRIGPWMERRARRVPNQGV